MDLIAESGIEQVKFYGMVGLPGETQEDLDETVRLLSSIKKKYRRLRLVFGLSSFVPKAQTPFQWSARDRDCASRSEFLRKNLAGIGIDVRIESSAWSDIQTLLSRADRRITPVLLELYQEKASLGAWKKAFRQKSAVCPGFDFYVFREIPDSEYLPWSHLMDSPRLAMLRAQKQLFQKETGNTV